MARSITVIPARANGTNCSENTLNKKRMAAYCRVSTDRLEQVSSYEAQVSFYPELFMRICPISCKIWFYKLSEIFWVYSGSPSKNLWMLRGLKIVA